MSSTDLWLPLGTAIIGAMAALAGNLLGPLFGSRREHEQWLRDKRASLLEDVYALQVEALDDATTRMVGGVFNPPPNFDDESYERSDALMRRLRDATSRAALYISEALAESLSSVWADYQVMYASQELYTREQWVDETREWEALVYAAQKEIRKELRIH